MNKIDSFQGEHSWLSNFYPCDVFYNGLHFLSSEAAFQAAKVGDNLQEMKQFCNLLPNEAKRLGRHVKLRDGWDEMRIQVMHDVLLDKFSMNPMLRKQLVATGEAKLIEGNDWHDTFWGVDNKTGIGENNLGKLLMRVRDYCIGIELALQ